jgi:dihydrofolate reductase
MRKLVVFNNVSMDGYFTGAGGDISWFQAAMADAEWNAFISGNAGRWRDALLFGRITYELMADFWPTAAAIKDHPVVAERMNNLPKVVFSRTLDEAPRSTTRLVKGDLAVETRKMKSEPGQEIVILGSGSIVSQLAEAGLIDEYQIAVNPVVLGSGRTMFEGVKEKLPLKLTKTRAFGCGNVVLHYEPTA